MLTVWKQVGLTILGSKIFSGLVALGDGYAMSKGYGITTSFEPACRAHDFFICSKVQKLVLKIIKQHESAKWLITSYSVQHAWATYGPRAKSGPPRLFIRPANKFSRAVGLCNIRYSFILYNVCYERFSPKENVTIWEY